MQTIKHTTFSLFIALLTPLLAVASAPTQATDVNPIEVGSTVPDVQLTGADGKAVALRALVAEQPTVMIFYRGSWCPFCTKHLAALGNVQEDILEAGYRIIALSADRIEKVSEYEKATDLNYTLYSDALLEVSSAFGLTFEVDANMLKKLDSYNIDIEAASGQKHHLLPVPAVYIVGTDGVITFRHYDPNYSKRLAPKDILKALK